MSNLFNLTTEEKNRIRGLHLNESKNKRFTSVLNEQATVHCAACKNGSAVSMAQSYPNPPGCVGNGLYPLPSDGGPQDPCNPGSWTPVVGTPPAGSTADAALTPADASSGSAAKKANPNGKSKSLKEQTKKTTREEWIKSYHFVHDYLKKTFEGNTITLYMDENGDESSEAVSESNIMKDIVWGVEDGKNLLSIGLSKTVVVPGDYDPNYNPSDDEYIDPRQPVGPSGSVVGDEEILAMNEQIFDDGEDIEVNELVWDCTMNSFIGGDGWLLWDILDGKDMGMSFMQLPLLQNNQLLAKLKRMCQMPQVQAYLHPGTIIGGRDGEDDFSMTDYQSDNKLA